LRLVRLLEHHNSVSFLVDNRVDAEAAGDVVLRDGTRVHIRPIRPEDDHALVDAFDHLSPQSVYQRFFTAMPELSDQMAHHLSHVNYTNRMALVAETAEDNPPRLMGVGRFEPMGDPVQADVVEIGLIVLDEWHGRGLGRILLRETLRIAVQHGFHRYSAEILSDNRKIFRLLSTEAEILESKSSGGVTSLLLGSR
jgi:RimJ/RimL family protein N-acetyltransferase